jgi:hypothetical protein
LHAAIAAKSIVSWLSSATMRVVRMTSGKGKYRKEKAWQFGSDKQVDTVLTPSPFVLICRRYCPN